MAAVQVHWLQDTKIEELRQKDEELQRKDEVRQKDTRLELQSQELKKELDQKNREVQEKDHLLQQLQLQLVSQATPTSHRQATPTTFTFKVSGAGLETATVKTNSQFSIESLYSYGGPCSSSQHVTAELTSTTSRTFRSVIKATVVQISPSTYELTYMLSPLEGGMRCV